MDTLDTPLDPPLTLYMVSQIIHSYRYGGT